MVSLLGANPGAQNSNTGPPNNYTNHIPVTADIQPGSTGNNPNRTVPAVGNHFLNGELPHVRPRLPGGFPVRDSIISSAPSDGYYSGGGLQSTQKGKYRNRDMKTELQDIAVEMDRITLGDLLEEGEIELF